jgi:hypothetical protein
MAVIVSVRVWQVFSGGNRDCRGTGIAADGEGENSGRMRGKIRHRALRNERSAQHRQNDQHPPDRSGAEIAFCPNLHDKRNLGTARPVCKQKKSTRLRLSLKKIFTAN